MVYTASTDVYWDVDGVPLNTYAWAVKTLGGSRGSVPTFRGSDQVVPFQSGARHRAKTPESKTETLLMWVAGMQDDGTPTDTSLRRQYLENLRLLQALFWRHGADQFPLTKRWADPDTGAVVSATAMASLVGNMEPTMTSPHRADFSVDLMLADPFYYGDEVETELAVDVEQEIVVAGNEWASAFGVSITFSGALTNPRVTNPTLDPAVWVQLGGSIDGGDSVVLDVAEFTAIRTSDSENLIGAVTQASRQWMTLIPGVNPVTLTASAGAGVATLRHRPVYW